MSILPVVLMWIVGILTILTSVGGFVLTYIQNHTLDSIPSIIGLVVGILVVVLNYFTNMQVTKLTAILTADQRRTLKLPIKFR